MPSFVALLPQVVEYEIDEIAVDSARGDGKALLCLSGRGLKCGVYPGFSKFLRGVWSSDLGVGRVASRTKLCLSLALELLDALSSTIRIITVNTQSTLVTNLALINIWVFVIVVAAAPGIDGVDLNLWAYSANHTTLNLIVALTQREI